MTLSATPAKLKSGAWGARVASTAVSVGDEVTIVAQSGKSWTATVSQIVWKGPDVTLVATGQVPQGGTCDNCQRPAIRLVLRMDSDAKQGRCCPECASLADYERAF